MSVTENIFTDQKKNQSRTIDLNESKNGSRRFLIHGNLEGWQANRTTVRHNMKKGKANNDSNNRIESNRVESSQLASFV